MIRVALCAALLLVPQAEEETSPLNRSVRRIADRLAQVRGEGFDQPPTAIRSPEVLAQTLAEARAFRTLSQSRLESRGRAWSDLGLGGPASPRRIWLSLASGLDGFDLDPQNRRILISPHRLTGDDYDGATHERLTVTDGEGTVHTIPVEGERPEAPSAEAVAMMATGVRPDEPALAHALMNLRQLERDGDDSLSASTTDGMLAAAAWDAGEANLVAVTFLFEGVGLVKSVLAGDLGPGDFGRGDLVPARMREATGVEKRMLEFVYEDGYRAAVDLFAGHGWSVFLGPAPRTTQQILRPGRWKPIDWEAPEPSIDGAKLVDTDRLGEQGAATLLLGWIESENSARDAAAGWRDDRLLRYEPADASPSNPLGVTLWESVWADEAAAVRFADAYATALQTRYPSVATTAEEGGWRVYKSPKRWIRLRQSGNRVFVRVSAPA